MLQVPSSFLSQSSLNPTFSSTDALATCRSQDPYASLRGDSDVCTIDDLFQEKRFELVPPAQPDSIFEIGRKSRPFVGPLLSFSSTILRAIKAFADFGASKPECVIAPMKAVLVEARTLAQAEAMGLGSLGAEAQGLLAEVKQFQEELKIPDGELLECDEEHRSETAEGLAEMKRKVDDLHEQVTTGIEQISEELKKMPVSDRADKKPVK